MKRLLRSILPFSGLVLAIILIKTISVSAYTLNNPTNVDASWNSRAIAASSPTTPEGAILVTTLEDELNNDGDCSLREAIQAANTNISIDACDSGDVLTDTITFDVAGVITVTSQLGVNPGGPLVIDGGDIISVSGGGTTRVWWVEMGSVLTLQHLAVVDGHPYWEPGGGMLNAGNVTIANSIVYGNYGNNGGGIYTYGTLTIINSTFSENSVGSELAAHGGAIYNSGIMTIINSTFSNNYVLGWGYGGGIYNGGTSTISNSIFSGNNADNDGGGVSNWGTLTVADSIFSGNTAGTNGGGVFNGGDLTIANSTFSGNIGHGGGSGIYNDGILTITDSMFSNNNTQEYGGGIYNFSNMTITNSTFSGNSAGGGGGIYSRGVLTITNSTFSGNIADYAGGGIYTYYYDLTIANSTFSWNSAESGGGIYNSYGSLTITNTIVANSPVGGDCYGSIIDGGHNLDSDGTCGLDPTNGSLPNTDPLLGPLQDNGGPTWTHALLWGSPAIDSGDNAQCPTTDQRGVPRPLDGNGDGLAVCDIGSFEAAISPTLVIVTGPSKGFVGESYLFTATVEPITITIPLEYVWQVSGLAPITHTGGLNDAVSFTWEIPGTRAITVTASNWAGSVMDTHGITITDVPISGLVAYNNSPTQLGDSTTFTATVTAGTNVIYTWDFGDESDGNGGIITHTYTVPGVYTATVTAANSVSSLTETILINIIAPIYPSYLPLVIKSSGEVLTPTHPYSLLGVRPWLGMVIVGAISFYKRRI